MKCPFITKVKNFPDGSVQVITDDCMEHNCALWVDSIVVEDGRNEKRIGCSMYDIGKSLRRLAYASRQA